MRAKLSLVEEPSQKLIFHDGHDWWSQWKGADYTKGWDRLRQKGSVQAHKDAGTGGRRSTATMKGRTRLL